MGDKFGFLSIVDFGATIWYILPPNVQCGVIHPNYYGIAVIFNYYSSGSSMYKILLLHVV
jgi:hypothetical protein